MTRIENGIIKIEMQGNAGDYTTLMKALTKALVLLPEVEDREQVGSLLDAMLPEEKQINNGNSKAD